MCPTKAIQNEMPIEAWSGEKPSVSHLRDFGCICYALVPNERRTKFDDKNEKCIFIGYSITPRAIDFITSSLRN